MPRRLEAEHRDLGVRRVIPDVAEGCSALVGGRRVGPDHPEVREGRLL